MPIQFTQDIYHFLEFSARESIISQIILDGRPENIKDEGNYLSNVDSEYIGYLPTSKYNKVSDPWTQSRTKIKIGRFIRKIFTEFSLVTFKINDSQIERFVNLYKSFFSRDKSKLKIVDGEDIKKYYLEENYYAPSGIRGGTLWNSCMRQRERNKFLTLYEKNSDSVKMLVYFSEEGLVRARALLWQCVKQHNSENEYKFMDRIYYVYEHDVDFFKDWAKENGYLSKWKQNAKTEIYIDLDRPEKMELYVNLPHHNLTYAPYLDTFKYYNTYRGRFSNSENWNYDYVLIQSNGSYEREPSTEENYDDENGW